MNQDNHDFSDVEKQRDFLTAEEFPEGPYGAPGGTINPVENKSSAWEKGQRYYSAFNYENKSLHQEPRQMAGAHPVHDNPDSEEQPPFSAADNSIE
jgi:hypothetical protein